MLASDSVRDVREVSSWAGETDVLVIGLGCAGASAACEAASAGADVVVAERASGGGGTSALSGGVIYLGGGTPLQQACGFEDSPEQMFRYLEASSGPAPDREKLRRYCEGSVEHFHWLEAQGVRFKPVFYPHYSGEPPTDDGLVYSGSESAHPFCEIAQPAPRGHVPRVEGAAGGLLMRTLVDAVAASGARLWTDTRCRALLVDPDAAVVGAVLQRDGGEHPVRARRGVVIASGGFILDRGMVASHAPRLLECKLRVGAEGDDGSGIRLGLAAGGSLRHMESGSISLPLVPPKSLMRGILVNGQGQRFINEDVYLGRLGEYALLRNEGHAFLILDDATFARPDVPREIVAVGDSPAQLERELELPSGSLESTLRLYNEGAGRGEDPVFHKAAEWLTPLATPPFAALDCRAASSIYAAFTLGGLCTSADAAVLSEAGEPIPGLFAAGRSTALFTAPGYSSGLSIGDGTFFGRRAGRTAAAR